MAVRGLPARFGLAALLLSSLAGESRAEILRCVGPAGELLYSNLGCSPGYSPVERREETPPSPRPAEVPAQPEAEAPPAGPEPQTPSPRVETVDERCFLGSFETEDAPGSIAVFFTNTAPRPCGKLSFSCLWGVGAGRDFYQQSGTGSHEGRLEPGVRARVGTMTPTGPRAADVSWSWCSIR